MNRTEAWDKELLNKMRGTPWNPVPWKEDMRIPVDITDAGEVVCEDDEVQSDDDAEGDE